MKPTILLLVVLAAAGCDKSDTKKTDASNDPAPALNAPADNTKKNERDQNAAALTAGNQSENENDRTITQRVRQGVMKEDGLSFSAKNVKIITVDGVVTLRGPVKTEKEKADIAAMAQRTDGVKRIDNQLEIVTN